jgi:hypothetical protein
MRVSLLISVALLSWPTFSAARVYEHRNILKPGHTEVTVRGRLRAPQDSALYSFSARAGQDIYMRVRPVTRRLVMQAVLILPSGQQEGPGALLKIKVHQAGTYKIRVEPREQSSGTFLLYLRVR